MIEFKFTTDPDQKFSMILNDRRCSFRFRYNVTTDRWSFDLSIDDAPVLQGRRVVTGVDLLAAYDFNLGIIFALETINGAVPGRDELPNGTVKLYHVMADEIDAAISS